MTFIALRVNGGTNIVPASAVGRIAVNRERDSAEVFDADGQRVGWIDARDAFHLTEEATTVAAAPGWWLVTLCDGDPPSLSREPIIAWHVDRDPLRGGVVPVTPLWETNQCIEDTGPGRTEYLILPPEGEPMG